MFEIRTFRGKILAELLRPLSSAFTELWLDGEKAATVEWRKDVDKVPGLDVDKEMVEDNGRGIVLDHPVEPLYGDIYMPRECHTSTSVSSMSMTRVRVRVFLLSR